MTQEALSANRHETAEIDKNNTHRRELMGWLAINTANLVQTTPENTGIMTLVEDLLPLPDKLAIKAIDQVAEETQATAEMINGMYDGDIEEIVESATKIVGPAFTLAA